MCRSGSLPQTLSSCKPFCNYYHHFVFAFAELASPPQQPHQEDITVPVGQTTAEKTEAFLLLKERLTATPIIAFSSIHWHLHPGHRCLQPHHWRSAIPDPVGGGIDYLVHQQPSHPCTAEILCDQTGPNLGLLFQTSRRPLNSLT